MEIHHGEGGRDSKMFVEELKDIYIKHSLIKKFQHCILTEEDGHFIIKLTGKGVYNAFKNESGKHIVQRVPVTEKNGRRQTSSVFVAVLSLPPENQVISLKDSDLEVICQTGKQKAGGQNVNKVASAVRMKHKPTGLMVMINGRDQHQNKKEALKILTARVNQMKQEKELNDYFKDKKDQLNGDKVRTYNFIRGDVVNHKSGTSSTNIKDILKGNLI